MKLSCLLCVLMLFAVCLPITLYLYTEQIEGSFEVKGQGLFLFLTQ